MKDDKNSGENLAGCVVGLLLVPFFIALRGWVLATLWRWLMVPIFAVRPLNIWQAIGVSVVVGVFTMKSPSTDDDSVLESVIRSTVYCLLSYGSALLLGWIAAHQI